MATINRIYIKTKGNAAGAPATTDVKIGELALNSFDGGLHVGTKLTAASGGTHPGGTPDEVSWVGAPILDQDDLSDNSATKLATQQSIKAYVDAAEARAAQGLQVKANAVAATTGAWAVTAAHAANTITLEDGIDSGGFTFNATTDVATLDTVTLAEDDIVLVKDSLNCNSAGASTKSCGLYVVGDPEAGTTLVLTRHGDMDADGDFSNAFVFVTGGAAARSDTGWVSTVDEGTQVVGTTLITFAQFNSAGSVTAGTNMTKSGNTLNVDDAFLKNDASDTMAGTLTATGLTTGNSGVVKFMDGNGSHYTTIAAHATTTTSQAYTLPAADGTNGQVLSTNGSGAMSWASAASSDVDVSVANLRTKLTAISDSTTIGDDTDVTITTAGALTATGMITANGGLTLGAGDDLTGSATSDIVINTDKFTVAGATGNTLVAGTLGVTGKLTCDDITAVGDAIAGADDTSSTGAFNFTPAAFTENNTASCVHPLVAGMTVNPVAITNAANGHVTSAATIHAKIPTHSGSSYDNLWSIWCGSDDGTTVSGAIGGAIISGGTY